MADLTISTDELIKAATGLKLIAGADITAKGAYAFRRARPVIAAAQAAFEETRIALAEKHARRDAAGAPCKKIVAGTEVFDIEDQAAFDAALGEIKAERITLSGVRPVTVAEFGDAKVSELAMTLLGPLVVDGETPA